MTVRSIDNMIVDLFSQMRGISVQGIKNFAGNLKPTSNKDLLKEIKSQTDILEQQQKTLENTEKNSAKLYKAFEKLLEQRQQQPVGSGNSNNSPNDNKDLFDDKAKVQESIVGNKTEAILTSIKGDTEEIVRLLKEGVRNSKNDEDDKGSRFGDLGLGDLAKGITLATVALATLAAAIPEEANAAKAAVTSLPAAARVAKGVLTTGYDAAKAGVSAYRTGAAAIQGGSALGAAAGAARAGAAAAAKNIFVGEQKVGTLGKIGAGLGAGATIGRYMEGDTTGATIQGISTILPLILAKTKFGKIANLASAAMDIGLLGRDYVKSKDKDGNPIPQTEEEKQLAAAEKQAKEAEAAALEPANKIASNTEQTNKLLEQIANGEIKQSSNNGMGMAVGLGAAALLGGGILKRGAGAAGGIAGASGATGILGGLLGRVGGTASSAASGAGNGLKIGAGLAAKGVAKSLPFIGLGMGAYGAYEKTKEGDYKGAALEAVGGIAAMIPVYGTAISLGIQGISATRDAMKAANADTLNTVKTNNTAVTSNIAAANDESNKQITAAAGTTAAAIADANAATNKSIAESSATANTSIANSAQNLDKTGSSLAATLGSASTSLLGMISKFGMLGLATTTTSLAAGAIQNLFKTDQQKLKTKLGQGDISGLRLGSVSAAFESGGRGVETVSTGKGDKGGVSYGKHQLSSKSGTMKEFLNSKYGQPFAKEFEGYEIGSERFNTKYKTVAKFKGDAFEEAQQKFIDQTHFGVQANAIKAKTGIDVNKRGRALQELIYSMSVQYRNLTPNIFVKALGKNANSLTDAEIIQKVMDYRAQNVQSDFRNSDAATQKAVGGRILTEKQMLLNIEAKNPSQFKPPKPTVAGATGGTAGTAKTGAGVTTGKTSNGVGSEPNSGAKAAKSAEYDLDKICSYAFSKAQGKSQGKCAEYVRKALQQGDNKKQINTLGHARDWNKTLPKVGFVQVGDKSAKKGDIAYFPPYKGSEYGHVCIYTGGQWVSDFKQKSVQPNSANSLPYVLFRAKSGYTNGASVGTAEGSDLVEGVDGAGVSEGSEGSETPDGLFKTAYDAVTGGVASMFNSEAMQSVKDFMKGDIYKTGDKTPMPKAQGNFTKDIDESDSKRKLRGAGNNGEADDLLGALGGDEILRQMRHANYGQVKRAMGGTDEILRQERPDNYEEVKRKMAGSNQIGRQMGGKNKWWMGLFDSLLGGNDLLGGLFGLLTGQRKLSDLTPEEILGQVQGAIGQGGIFEGGKFNGRAVGRMLGVDVSSAMGDLGGFGGGFGGGLPQNEESVTSATDDSLYTAKDGSTITTNPDGSRVVNSNGRVVTVNPDGTVQSIQRNDVTPAFETTGGFVSDDTAPSKSFASRLGRFLGIPKVDLGGFAVGGGFGGGISYSEPDSGTRVYEGDNDPTVQPEKHAGDIRYAIDKRLSQLEGGAFDQVQYDPTEKMEEDREMQMAMHQFDENEKRKYETMVQIPPSVQTPTGKEPRGKTPQEGLGSMMIVKNPDTIIHTIAVGMMGRSV